MKHNAPGVAIELIDESGYSVVDNPSLIAGVVGYSSKGEFNKLIKVTNTAVQDTKLGSGYNSARWNMGMYATRAVLNAGGHVHFVRPYGETVSAGNMLKQALKSDAFVIAYDRDASTNADNTAVKNGNGLPHTSINIRHFAATRYGQDGLSAFGGTRRINTVAETVASHSNTDFGLTANDDWYEGNSSARGESDTVLFSIINSDPTSAHRAGDRYTVKSVQSTDTVNNMVTIVLGITPDFTVGDTVFVPSKVEDNGTEYTYDCTGTVTAIDDATVTLALSKTITTKFSPSAIYVNSDDSSTGVDYLTVRTPTAGKAVKKLESIKFNPSTFGNSGSLLTFRDADYNEVNIRVCRTSEQSSSVATLAYSSNEWILTTTINYDLQGTADLGDTVTIVATPNGGTSGTYTGVIKTTTSGNSFALYSLKDANGVSVDGATTTFVVTSATPTFAGNSVAVIPEMTVTSEAAPIVSTASIVGSVLTITSTGTVKASFDAIVNNGKYLYGTLADGSPVLLFISGVTETSDTVGGTTTYTDVVTVGGAYVRAGSSGAYMYLAYSPSTAASVTLSSVKKMSIGAIDGVSAYDQFSANGTSFYVASELADTTIGTFPLLFSAGDPEFNMQAGKYYDVTSVCRQIVQVLDSDMSYTEDGGNSFRILSAVESGDVNIGDITTLHMYKGTSGNFTAGDKTIVSPEPSDTGKAFRDTGDAPGYISRMFEVASVNTYNDTVVIKGHIVTDGGFIVNNTDGSIRNGYKLVNVTTSAVCATVSGENDDEVGYIGRFSMIVSGANQKLNVASAVPDGFVVSKYGSTGIVISTGKILMDSDIGSSFLKYGLATVDYVDVEFSGTETQVYQLTADGETMARLYMYVTYYFNGEEYDFEGTVTPFVYNDIQFSIEQTAATALTDSGATFILNDSGSLDAFIENNSYDLSQTVVNGIISSSVTQLAYDQADPAIVHDAIWKYLPSNNNTSAILSAAWNLFLDKDGTDVGMLISAGTDITSLFMKNRETLDFNVIDAMLNVCELRKDVFGIFDGVGEGKIATTLKKMIGIGSSGTKSRWGTMYDGRSYFTDTLYTHSKVEVVRSVQMASVIVSNAASGIWWLPPAGMTRGIIPAAWCSEEKYPRTFNYPEDPDSDIAKLIAIHANPVRSNDSGNFMWGDYTMQLETTAFDQTHVAMLVAGIHKRFYKYLDTKTFRLNTVDLRSEIQTYIQSQLDAIRTASQSGLVSGVCICDSTNNTQEVIDRSEVIVDVKIKPTKSARYITLRSTVLSNGTSNTITTTVSES